MKTMLFGAIGLLALTTTAVAGALTWDDSYPRGCCGFYRGWVVLSGPGYFQRRLVYRYHPRRIHHRRYMHVR